MCHDVCNAVSEGFDRAGGGAVAVVVDALAPLSVLLVVDGEGCNGCSE